MNKHSEINTWKTSWIESELSRWNCHFDKTESPG